MAKEELKAKFDDPNFVISYVRTGIDWRSCECKNQGIIRNAPEGYEKCTNVHPKYKTLVLYCA